MSPVSLGDVQQHEKDRLIAQYVCGKCVIIEIASKMLCVSCCYYYFTIFATTFLNSGIIVTHIEIAYP